MILKASQRGGAKQLGLHLMNGHDNEHVEVHEIRGFLSEDVVGALRESYAVSRGTKCEQHLFSCSFSPPPQENVPVEHFEDAINRVEVANGLYGQPRVVVFHEKEGRRHAHAVWSRIDAQTMTAKPLPYFKYKLRDVSKTLYREHDWKMPEGLIDAKQVDPKNYTLEEYHQAKRMKRDAAELKGMFQDCWAASDSKAGFEAAIEERGFWIAKGDRRGYVGVSHKGDTLNLARYLGKKTKDLKDRLGEPDDLRSLDDTKAHIAKAMTPTVERLLNEAGQRHAAKQAPLNAKRQSFTDDHTAARERLKAQQAQREQTAAQERSQRLNSGWRGLWQRLTGKRKQIEQQNLLEAQQAKEQDRKQRDAQIAAQLQERQRLQAQIQEARAQEVKTMTDLHRDLARLRRGEIEPRKVPEQKQSHPTRKQEVQTKPALNKDWQAVASPQSESAKEPDRPTPQARSKLDELKTRTQERNFPYHGFDFGRN